MIKEGQKKEIRYWGKFTVDKVARLRRPVACRCEEVGTVLFDPTIVKIQCEKSPSDNEHEFWFTCLITIGGRERYGQFAPMVGERALLELIEDAVRQDLFSPGFLKALEGAIEAKLES